MSEHGLCCVECYGNGTAQGEHAGAVVERERIIALLNRSYPRLNGAAEWAIALIKGEKE